MLRGPLCSRSSSGGPSFGSRGDSTDHWKDPLPNNFEGSRNFFSGASDDSPSPVHAAPRNRDLDAPISAPEQGAFHPTSHACQKPPQTRAPHVTLRQHAPSRVSINGSTRARQARLETRDIHPPFLSFNLYLPNRWNISSHTLFFFPGPQRDSYTSSQHVLHRPDACLQRNSLGPLPPRRVLAPLVLTGPRAASPLSCRR